MVLLIGALLTLSLAAPVDVPEIKSTTRLTVITGDRLIEITAPEVLALSHVFAGQFLGALSESPDPRLPRHTVIFDVQTQRGIKHGAYAVQYVFDDASGDAFIYLPGQSDPSYRSNISTMIRDGQDGRWHRAAGNWAAFVRAHIQAAVQPVQYRSPAGMEYRSLPETDAIKTARAAHEADPKNIAKIIELGVAQSGARQFREAIATFSKGLEIEPNNALLLRWRGHRHLSVREFDRAFADLSRGSQLDPRIYGNWYHLGIIQFERGDFGNAAASFANALPLAPDAGELQGSVDWLWMSLSRAGKHADAKAMLDRKHDHQRPDLKPVTNAYTQRIKLYRGEIGPDAVVTAADTDDTQIATVSYGLGNWFLVKGDKAQARKWFERAVSASGGWPGFGFILSEIELQRLR